MSRLYRIVHTSIIALTVLQVLAIALAHTFPRPGNLPVAITLAIATIIINTGVARFGLATIKQYQVAYTEHVTLYLEQSFENYRTEAEQDLAIARSVGGAIEEKLALAQNDLATQDADAVRAHLAEGILLASEAPIPPCDSIMLAAVLRSKYHQCSEVGVELITKTAIPEDLPLDEVDTATIFFSLIDNALYECLELAKEEGANQNLSITVRARIQAGQLFVEVMSPCKEGAAAMHRLVRRYPDPMLYHGLGTGIVIDIAQKYGGISEFAEHDGNFVSTVMIPLPTSN